MSLIRMHRIHTGLLLLAGWMLALAPLARAQAVAAPSSGDSVPLITVLIEPPPISISSSMIGVAGPLGAQAVAGKPISARFVTEHHQSFADGNRISRSTTSVLFRDIQGRIRRESQLSLPGLPADVAVTFITIVDHSLGYGWVLNPQELVAHRYNLNRPGPAYVAHLSAQGSGHGLLPPDYQTAGAAANAVPAHSSDSSRWRVHVLSAYRHRSAKDSHAAPAAMGSASGSSQPGSAPEETDFACAPDMRIAQPFLAAPNAVRTENLGESRILGFRVHGTRVITTLPAGEIGNDRPIDIVSEQWFSPELALVMRSMHRDPWAGQFITTVVKVSRSEPPATLFKVPARYKITDSETEAEHHVLDAHGSSTAADAPR